MKADLREEKAAEARARAGGGAARARGEARAREGGRRASASCGRRHPRSWAAASRWATSARSLALEQAAFCARPRRRSRSRVRGRRRLRACCACSRRSRSTRRPSRSEKARSRRRLRAAAKQQLFRAYLTQARQRFPSSAREAFRGSSGQACSSPRARSRPCTSRSASRRRRHRRPEGQAHAGLGDQILRETIDELLAESWKKILLNLSEVSFMDSAGVGELVAGLQDRAQLRRVAEAPERQRARPLDALHRAPAAGLRDLPDERGRGARRASARGLTVPPPSVVLVGERHGHRVRVRVTCSSIAHSGQFMVSPTSSS